MYIMGDYEVNEIFQKKSDHQIIKYIFDLSKQMNVEGTQGVLGNELELITLVRNCKFLYDRSLPDFKDIRKKNVAWGAIASVMHAKVPEVQQRWRSLREGYNKYVKEIELIGENNIRGWEFYEEMKFIEPFIVPRNKACIISDDENTKETANEREHRVDMIEFINCIRTHPVLYDGRHPDYKVREKKMQAWSEVAQRLDCLASECEYKWKTLRERYGRERKLKGFQNDKKQWEYFEALNFLDTHIKPRRHSLFRPILPKPALEDANNVILGNPVSTSEPQPTYIIKQLKSSKPIAMQEDITIRLNPNLDLQHVEFVEATSSSTSNSPTPTDPKLRAQNSYLSPASEASRYSHDEDELFGQTITAELRRIASGKKKMKIKAEIYKILCDNESDS